MLFTSLQVLFVNFSKTKLNREFLLPSNCICFVDSFTIEQSVKTWRPC